MYCKEMGGDGEGTGWDGMEIGEWRRVERREGRN